jgi:predicted homoserine dehydrogenase-like protein
MPAQASIAIGGLPIGLANHVRLRRDVPLAACVTWDDVRIDEADETYRFRRQAEMNIRN